MTNIVLAGFMGTGKTSVGREVARRLGRPFADTDEMVERAAGMTVAQVFAGLGEAAFREMERRALAEAAAATAGVIAVGGGALLDDESRAALEATGRIVCLDADVSSILERVGQADDRPVLAGGPTNERVGAVLAARQDHYDSLPWHVDTTNRTISEVAEAVIARCAGAVPGGTPGGAAENIVIHVNVPGAEYHVHVGSGLLASAGTLMRGLSLSGPAVVVAQPMPRALYWPALRRGLRRAGITASVAEIPDGESNKTLATVAGLYDRFAALELDRGATIVALGGGVTGDLAGFAAATYLRGLPVVQAPTTLLAMVDASVGGKTAVDLPAGKNMVGAFHQPRLVICDVDTLATLPESELRSGLAEVIKTAVLGDAALFTQLERLVGLCEPWPMAEIVASCVRVKAAIVESDPLEQGPRAVLNLGHTIGHGVELASGYRYRHGEAVSIGLAGAARLAAVLGYCPAETAARIPELLRRAGLPVAYTGLAPDKVIAAMRSDKKRRQGRLRWVLPTGIGSVVVTADVPEDAAASVIADLAAS